MKADLPYDQAERDTLVRVLTLQRSILGRDPGPEELLRHHRAVLAGATIAEVSDALLASPGGRAAGSSLSHAEGNLSPAAADRDPGLAEGPSSCRGLDVLRVFFPHGIPVENQSGYAWWLDEMQAIRAAQRESVTVSNDGRRVAFMLPVDRGTSSDACGRTILSLSQQTDPRWILILVCGPVAALKRVGLLRRSLTDSRLRVWIRVPGLPWGEVPWRLVPDGDLLCWLHPGDSIAPIAVADLLAGSTDADVVSSDGDGIDSGGLPCNPAFGGGWDPDGALTQPPRGLVAIRAGTLRETKLRRPVRTDEAWEIYANAAAITRPDRIRHLPRVLCHRALGGAPPANRLWDSIKLVQRHLARTGRPDCLVIPGRAEGTLQVVHPIPTPAPLVSIIVLTRDRAGLLRTCLEGVLAHTTYPAIEVIVVDNGSQDQDTHDLFALLVRDPRVRVIRDESPFDWSALNHVGITASRGEVILLLNNDIEILEAGWLREMVSQAVRSDVGLVGAKLLYPAGDIQHAGIVLDDISAWHVWRHAPGDSPGYRSQLMTVRTVSAVTGACVAMRRSIYEEIGGLERTHLAVTWGDVDLCLRVRRAGYRVVWTPEAVLCHVEQATRGSDGGSEQQARFDREARHVRNVWGAMATHDPFFSPNLSPAGPTAAIRIPAAVRAGP